MTDEREMLERELDELRYQLEDARYRLPAHTIRPHQLLAIEALEEKITELEEKLLKMD